MIAHDSRGIPENARTLSEPVSRRVREAIEARWSATTEADIGRTTDALAGALDEAAVEARERSLHPEELILAIKALEDQVAAAHGRTVYADRRQLRDRLVTACIQAYFRPR